MSGRDEMHNSEFNWIAMTPGTLVAVHAIAGRVHPDYPEDQAVFQERRDLYPAGCFLLQNNEQAVGYVLSHPWLFKQPPALNVLLGAIPPDADTYYIHDIALLPEARAAGVASIVVDRLIALATACAFSTMSLVAVNQSVRFWEKHRFEAATGEGMVQKLESYGGDARYMVRELP
jgi:ribosomal protein S18 acetylase RimI-like enzyme